MTMADLLAISQRPETAGCSYMFGGLQATDDELQTAAEILADEAMRLRCGNSPVLAKWRARRNRAEVATNTDDPERREIEVFVAPVFGLPDGGKTELNKLTDHIQGFVAELLWNRIIQDRVQCLDGRTLMHTEEIKGDPTGTGGDGFVVYEIADGTLVFRLWEIKKHVSKSPISATIKRAADQLSEHGARYLAMLTGPGSKHEGALGQLYGELVRLWLEASPRAGIGVSVATSAAYAPDSHPTFTNVAPVFPQFPAEGQREALLVAVSDFAAFAERVRGIVWTGL
ncbi:hypothetical protein [Actinomadura latina]|uniref:Anti-bacteriophage protein A/HamA C-terminal domain-containing protein n=1 Tax=Actinomadura latina TaxID=163603 RepID=A0A846Z5Z5_9ACTN|nr:hypothetical protein [Actinomadura latina]NKZ08830.1 hypothetical protein [Actinomadura latina]